MPYFKNDSENVLFIHIPKTGGTSCENYLSFRFNIPLNYKSLFGTHQSVKKFPGIKSSLQHITYNQIVQYSKLKLLNIDFNNIKIFTIVRNPYERIMSDLFYLKLITIDTTKEIVFDIVGEINLDILKNFDTTYNIPIDISIEDIKNKYFKDKQELIIRKVSNKNEIGFINGMYATSQGVGGTLPIHARYFPCDKFLDLKLTGLQQDVMRESMHVALTVAWNLTSLETQIMLRKNYDNDNNKCGINIHTGDGSVAKDGPSGGCAIACALYSLLNNIAIKPEFGITGEIQMSGEVTAIGGLNYKILGSLKSNVKSFIFPKENEKDFKEFYEKYKDSDILKDVSFYPINHVNEALNLILEK